MKYLVYRTRKIFNQRAFLRLTKKTLVSVLIFIILFIGSGFLYLFNPFTKEAQAVWFDDNWSYREAIPISTHTASENNVYLTVSGVATTDSTRFNTTNCGNVRFTKQNGELLPFYVLSGCNSANTTFHVLFDTFPAGAQTIYMYYGNTSVVNGAAGADFSTACGNGCAVGTIASEEKATAPLAYWKFDEGTGTAAKDSTSNAFNGTITGSTWQTEDQCIFGKCLFFRGSSDKVSTTTSNIGMNGTAAATWEVWQKPTVVSGTVSIMNKDTDNIGGGWSVYLNGTSMGFFDGTSAVIKQANLAANTWVHLAWSYSAGTVSYYKNGVLQGTTTGLNSTLTDDGSTLCLGLKCAITAEAYNGFMDEPKIYNYARSGAQILADYNSRANLKGGGVQFGSNAQNQPNALSNGLVGYWKMDESSWTQDCTTATAIDSSGNGNTGKSCPGTTGPSTSSTAKFSNAGSFDGTDDYVDIADSSSLDLGNTITLSAWIRPGAWNTYNAIFSKGVSNNRNYYMDIRNSGYLIFCIYNSSTPYCLLDDTTSISLNIWTHVAASYDGNTIRLFVNGVQVKSGAESHTPDSNNSSLFIGKEANPQLFNGKIDEARVYNRALSSADVATLYNFAPGPVGYWKLEEGSGITTVDSSGNANSGTLTSSPTWTTGKFGKAINFSGGSYVRVTDPSSGVLDFGTGDFSYGFWMKQNSGDVGEPFYKGGTSAGDTGYDLETYSGGNAATDISDGTTIKATSGSTTVNDGNWHYIFAVVDRSGVFGTAQRLYLFVDGKKDVTPTDITSVGSVSNATNLDFARVNSYAGKIDEVKIYNYVRSQKQIIEDMNASHPTGGSPIGTPVGYWRFDEGADNTCSGGSNDVCNSGFKGSLLDGAETNMSVPATSTSGWTQSGKFGKGLIFDGTTGSCTSRCDDLVNAGSDSSIDNLTANPMSLSAWIYPNTMGESSQGVIMAKNSGATPSSGWLLQFAGTNALKFSVDGTTDLVRTTSNNAVTLGAWNYVTLTWDGVFTTASSVHIFVNGIEASYQTTTNGATIVSDAASSLYFGNDSSGASTFDGTIDEVKIYAGALTQSEILLDMNRDQAQTLGALSDNSTYQKQAANQAYCIPGDSTSCAAPVGEWKFDEGSGTSAQDTSGNANTGTITSSTYATGKLGKGMNFNGSSGHVNVGHNSSLNDLTVKTIETWVYTRSAGGGSLGRVVDKSNGSSAGYYLLAINSGKGIDFNQNFSGSEARWSTANNTVTFNAWYHISVTYDDSSTSNAPLIYVNGVSQTVSTDNAASGTVQTEALNDLWIGDKDTLNRTFDGVIDQVRVFNYARSGAQVAWDYNKGGPVAWYRFDECQGTTLNDSSGRSNTGTWNGTGGGTQTSAGTCTTSSTAWGNGVTGKYNSSLNFDGTDDYVNTTTSYSNPTPFSISGWFKTNIASGHKIVGLEINQTGTGSLNFDRHIYMGSDGKIYFGVWNGSGVTIASTNTLNDNNWHYFAATHDSSNNNKLYIDGVLNSSGNAAAQSFTGYWRIGSYRFGVSWTNATDGYFTGQIDDVRIFNYVLTATQTKNIYNEGFATRFGPAAGAP